VKQEGKQGLMDHAEDLGLYSKFKDSNGVLEVELGHSER
jgi:hypothetical protein